MPPPQIKIYQWNKLIFSLIDLIILLATLYSILRFLHGALQYLTSNKYNDTKKSGKNHMINAAKMLVISISIWILLIILGNAILGPIIVPVVLPSP